MTAVLPVTGRVKHRLASKTFEWFCRFLQGSAKEATGLFRYSSPSRSEVFIKNSLVKSSNVMASSFTKFEEKIKE